MKLARVSIDRPVFAAMIIAALVVFGLISYPKIGVDLFPNAEFPVVTVTVVYPGADPETMESKVAEPIEEVLQSMSGIDSMTSLNTESLVQIIVQFELEVSADDALQEMRDKISTIEGNLPSGIEPPLVQKFDIGAAPIMSVAVAGDIGAAALSQIADERVKQTIERVPGVGGADLIGARERVIEIVVDPNKLTSYGLTVQDVGGALAAQSLDLPAGSVHDGAKELSIKTKGEVRSVAEIGAIVIPRGPGMSIRVRDVADVREGLEDARSASALDGKSAVALVVRKQSGANTVEVAARVRAAVEEIRPELEKAGVTISVPTDSSVYIEHSIHDVQFDLLFGAGLTIIIIFIFLGDARATLISALALPTSVIGSFLVMQLLGFTFNNLTMLALSLSIGILVDDAIVVIENIHRHLEMGKPKAQAAYEATAEIGLAVLATTLCIVAVFVPVAVMKGLIGRFFFQFGITVAVAVLLSMFVSFTLTPVLSSRILSSQHGKKFFLLRGVDWFMNGLANVYAKLVGASLRHPVITLAVATASFVGAVSLLSQIKTEFVPPEDRAQFAIDVETPTGTSLQATEAIVEAIAKDARENIPHVRGTFATVGDAAGSQLNKGRIEVLLVGSKERPWRQQDAMAWARERYDEVGDAEVKVAEIAAVSGGGQSTAPIQFVLKGKDLAELTAAADEIVARMRETPGFVDVDTNNRAGKPELSIEIDRERAADLGVPVATIAQTIRALVAGDAVGELRDEQGTADVTLRLPEAMRARLGQVPNLKVRSSSGALVELSSIVHIERGEGPSLISRLDRQRQVTVLANLEGMPLGEAQIKVREIAADVVPSNISTGFVGMVEIMEESFGHMVFALGLAVVIVYMILAAQFNSFLQPIAIMLSLPLSFIGAFGALYVAGMTMNIFSMIGLIMLMGLVTKNAILLVDFANAARAEGRPVIEALVEAGRIRLRPILMTTAAMIFGMLPVALAISEGGETRAPMAWAVIGGLITSTLLTLVVVPVVYLLLDKLGSSRMVRCFGRLIAGRDAHEAKLPVPVSPSAAAVPDPVDDDHTPAD